MRIIPRTAAKPIPSVTRCLLHAATATLYNEFFAPAEGAGCATHERTGQGFPQPRIQQPRARPRASAVFRALAAVLGASAQTHELAARPRVRHDARREARSLPGAQGRRQLLHVHPRRLLALARQEGLLVPRARAGCGCTPRTTAWTSTASTSAAIRRAATWPR